MYVFLQNEARAQRSFSDRCKLQWREKRCWLSVAWEFAKQCKAVQSSTSELFCSEVGRLNSSSNKQMHGGFADLRGKERPSWRRSFQDKQSETMKERNIIFAVVSRPIFVGDH